MTTANGIDINDIEQVCGRLDDEATELIDFDSLRALLSRIKDTIGAGRDNDHELTVLRDDYRGRILGMLKANLACRDNEPDRDLAAALMQKSDHFKAVDLIKVYRRTAARFRANFPTSFRYLEPVAPTDRRLQGWSDFKL